MDNEKVLNSIILLDRCISELTGTIGKLEDPKYEGLVDSIVGTRISVILNQIYKDRSDENYRAAFRKCIFLKKYIEKEMR